MSEKYITPELEVVWLGERDAVTTSTPSTPPDENELPIVPIVPKL